MSCDEELVGNRILISGNSLRDTIAQPKNSQLRAVESECDYFRKLLNAGLFRKLVVLQVVASITIVLTQVLIYDSIEIWNFTNFLANNGTAIFIPILVFAPTIWLTHLTISNPSRPAMGAAMTCHIVSILFGALLILFSIVAFYTIGNWSSRSRDELAYNPLVLEGIIISVMLLAELCVIAGSFIAVVQCCKLICCGRHYQNYTLFNVETY